MHIRDSFISVDCESTGPVPGLYSMIDLGAAQVSDTTNTFSASLKELKGAGWSDGTRKFWTQNDHNARTLSEIESRARDIEEVMWEFRTWLAQFNKPVLVGFPITFDFSFIAYYWWLVFKCEPPFGWGGCDIKTLGACVTRSGFRETTKKNLKKKLPQGQWHHAKHTHFGVDDAIEQSILFSTLMEKL